MNKTYLVNANGEILKEINDPNKYIELSDGDKVVRKGVLQYLSETTDIRYHFIKINPLLWGKMANKYPILNDLIKYLGYMDNILAFKNGKPLEMKNLPDVCKKSMSTIKRQIKGLIEEDVIHKIKDEKKRNVFVINPFIAINKCDPEEILNPICNIMNETMNFAIDLCNAYFESPAGKEYLDMRKKIDYLGR